MLEQKDLKQIYYQLATNNVTFGEYNHTKTYYFGFYNVNMIDFGYKKMITVCEYGKDENGKRGACYGMSTWAGEKINPFFEECQIYTAAKNKYEGKEYKDPFKNLPVQTVVNESANIFEKTILKNAVDIFPYDMPEQQYMKTIAEMKNIFAQKMRQYNGNSK